MTETIDQKREKCPHVVSYLESIRNFHDQSSAGRKYFDRILEEGECFTREEVMEEKTPEVEKHLKIVEPQVKECFHNSWRMSLLDDDYKYYGGYYMAMIPSEHAWVVKDGKVIDPTDEIRVDEYGGDPATEYFGRELPIPFVSKHLMKGSCMSALTEFMMSVEEEND